MLKTNQVKWLNWLKYLILGFLAIFCLSLLSKIIFKLPVNASHPIDGILVLGGSIYREIYVAELAITNPEIPILISTGSDDPCIWLIFQAKQAPMDNVFLEKCADSTFTNFFYSIPILQNWNVHKVKLITSTSHLPRAKWLAQIMLNSQGIALEVDTPPIQGIPGNKEMWLKTALDVVRSIVWGLISQGISPSCDDFTPLVDMDWQKWETQGFVCERQQIVKLNYD